MTKNLVENDKLNMANEYFLGIGGRRGEQDEYSDTLADIPKYNVRKTLTRFPESWDIEVTDVIESL